jgi:predicted SAM-dependent methyltransferase
MSKKLTIKQKFGKWLIPRLPVNSHVFNHFRLELNAWIVRTIFPVNPFYVIQLARVRKSKKVLLNIGCGPFGKENWINIDLFPHPNLTLRYDSRKKLPLDNNSCQGIHVEHFFEHLNPSDEVPAFLKECYRCMQNDAVLRIIVPDLELYIKAYLADGWKLFNQVGCGTDKPQEVFKTKMDALNHVFVQGWEHYGGYDSENLELVIREAGFTRVKRVSWRSGDFPFECIDREQHRPYSLYFEAQK